MRQEEPSFFFEAIEKLRTLSPEAKPLWGSMSPQHMVEHLVGSWRISNGNARVKPMLREEEIEQRRSFLFSDQPYERNIPNPVFKDGPPPLRKTNLAAAVEQLEQEMNDFFDHHANNPGVIEVHPVFGSLDQDGWLTFQRKHMTHHLLQFGLLEG